MSLLRLLFALLLFVSAAGQGAHACGMDMRHAPARMASHHHASSGDAGGQPMHAGHLPLHAAGCANACCLHCGPFPQGVVLPESVAAQDAPNPAAPPWHAGLTHAPPLRPPIA